MLDDLPVTDGLHGRFVAGLPEFEKVARGGPEPLFATISGAHLYGFASPNSDVDLRGAFVLPARAFLGLGTAEETLSLEDTPADHPAQLRHEFERYLLDLGQVGRNLDERIGG